MKLAIREDRYLDSPFSAKQVDYLIPEFCHSQSATLGAQALFPCAKKEILVMMGEA